MARIPTLTHENAVFHLDEEEAADAQELSISEKRKNGNIEEPTRIVKYIA